MPLLDVIYEIRWHLGNPHMPVKQYFPNEQSMMSHNLCGNRHFKCKICQCIYYKQVLTEKVCLNESVTIVSIKCRMWMSLEVRRGH